MKRKILSIIAALCLISHLGAYAVNTGNQAADIVETAKSQLGYTGNNKHTKYNKWFYTVDQAAPWCAIFISWCASEAGIPNSVIGKNALASGFGTYNMENNPFGTKSEAFNGHAPRLGDIIFVDNDNDGISNHVGLVSDFDDEYIYTVEGNIADRVRALRYSRSTGYNDRGTARILFYAVPEYAQGGFARTESGGYTEIVNNSGAAREADIIIAEYDLGRLVDVKIERVIFAAGEARSFWRGDNAKLFAWDGMEPII